MTDGVEGAGVGRGGIGGGEGETSAEDDDVTSAEDDETAGADDDSSADEDENKLLTPRANRLRGFLDLESLGSISKDE